MNKSELMSYAEYSSEEYPTPYLYHLSKGCQHLYFFGSRHTYDFKDEQISTLEAFWDEFLDATKGLPRVALIEGGERSVAVSKSEAIETGGEIQYVSFLASENSISIESPEPPESHWFQELEKKFPKDAVAYYDFARVCYQWNQKKARPAFVGYIKDFLESNRKKSGWKDYDFSLEHMKEVHKDIFQSIFNENDKHFFYDVINPTTSFSIINEVSRADDEGIRDIYILGNQTAFGKREQHFCRLWTATCCDFRKGT